MTAQYYAIQTLLQYNIKEFSILVDDIESILLDRGWIIKSYDINSSDYIDIFKRMGVLDIAKYSPAFSIKTDNNMILFYRNNLSNAGKRFALAHELGHDIMGHFSKHGILGFQENGLLDDNQEREANEFALEFLAPICVLSVNRISTVEDISMFSLLDKRFTDILVQPARKRNEYSAFCSMVDSADIHEHSKVIFFGDRGYTSYNNFAHVIEKGQYFLIRCNDKRASGMMGYPVDTLPAFDEDISLILTRSKAVSKYSRPELFSSYRYIYQNAPMDYLNDQRTEYDLCGQVRSAIIVEKEEAL